MRAKTKTPGRGAVPLRRHPLAPVLHPPPACQASVTSAGWHAAEKSWPPRNPKGAGSGQTPTTLSGLHLEPVLSRHDSRLVAATAIRTRRTLAQAIAMRAEAGSSPSS